MRFLARFPDGTKKTRSLYGRDKNELKKRFLKEVSESLKCQSAKTGGPFLRDYLPEWLEGERTIKGSTKRGYNGIINNHILPKLGGKRVSELTFYTVQKLVDDLIYKDGRSVRLAQQIKCILTKSLRKARRLGLTTNTINPGDIQLPHHEPKERNLWTKEDLKRFLGIIKGDRYEFFYTLYITYGLRRGEAIALTWKDIDFETGVIHITKNYCKQFKSLEITTPKTKSSIRDLPLMDNVLELLNNLRSDRLDLSGFIIADKDGNPIVPDSVSRHFDYLVRKNNLPKVVLHSLRHFAATGLKDAGVPLKDTAVILGHSSIATTLKYYQHSDIETEKEALQKYREMLNFS